MGSLLQGMLTTGDGLFYQLVDEGYPKRVRNLWWFRVNYDNTVPTHDRINFEATIMAIPDLAHEGAGLAATQVDYHYRLIVVMRESKPPRDPIVMVNPKITSTFATTGHQEGCLSIQRGLYRAFKRRAKNITVEYQDLEGSRHTLKARNFLAACIQHEVQHLSGILFTD